jgi:hypothetical protein
MNKELLKIGIEVASLWGAECYNYKVIKENKEIVFYCIEAGEKFTTSVSFEDLKSEYNYKGEL